MNLINTVDLGYYDDEPGSWLTAIVSAENARWFYDTIGAGLGFSHLCDSMSRFEHGPVVCFNYSRVDSEAIKAIEADIRAGKYPLLTLIEQ